MEAEMVEFKALLLKVSLQFWYRIVANIIAVILTPLLCPEVE